MTCGTTHFVVVLVDIGGGAPLSTVAVIVVSEFSATAQGPRPEQPPPDHPAKAESGPSTAVRITCVPALNECEHVEPQLIPVGLLVTVPVLPESETVSVWCLRYAGVVKFGKPVPPVPDEF